MISVLKYLLSSFLMATAVGPTSVSTPKNLNDARIIEKLGQDVDIQNLHFRDETGNVVPLSTYFVDGKPVILSLVYFSCPHLCTLSLNGEANSLRSLDWTAGKEFRVVTVSIDPTETPALASAKKASYMKLYGRLEAPAGWHFLTGAESQVKALADQIGFGYFYDKDQKEYVHSAGIFVLTPKGKISRILYGVDFPAKDLKLSLLEASNGQVGTIVDRFVMFCYRYDASAHGYALYIMRLLRVGALLTLLVGGGYLLVFWKRQRKLAKQEKSRKAA